MESVILKILIYITLGLTISLSGGDDHYKQFLGLGLYNLYNINVEWGDAWEQCKLDGGHLLVVDSEQELKVARQLIKERTEAYYTYIGVHDLLKQNHFITVKDDDFQRSEYNKVHKARNNAGDIDHCMALTSSGYLVIMDCEARYPFICEIEQGKE